MEKFKTISIKLPVTVYNKVKEDAKKDISSGGKIIRDIVITHYDMRDAMKKMDGGKNGRD